MAHPCYNCNREKNYNGRYCSPCREYRNKYGTDRPLEFEEKRLLSTCNDTGKCTNCERPIPNKNPLCHTCYTWKLRHNGEMRPISQEQRIKNPKITIAKEKVKICGKCRYRQIKGMTLPCHSCNVKQQWRDGKYANRKPGYRYNKWYREEEDFIREHAGKIPAAEITRRLNQTFVHQRTEAAVIYRARIMGVSLVVYDGYTEKELAYMFGVCSQTIQRIVKSGLLVGVQYTPNGRLYFDDDAIERFLTAHPYMVNKDRMRSAKFKSIVFREFTRDPWFTIEEVAKMFGYTRSGLGWYIYYGRIETVPKIGEYAYRTLRYIRRSAINEFRDSKERAS